MPRNYTEQKRRHEIILELIEKNKITSHAMLVQRLSSLDIKVTQSSVSRDFDELKISKVDGAYKQLVKPANDELIHEIRDFIKSIDNAGSHILLLKTSIGAAQRVAAVIDRLKISQIVGTISGDDTILIATRNQNDQKIISSTLNLH